MSDKKPPRSGSARAKLESFERNQKGKRSFQVRMIIILVMLGLAVAVQFVLFEMSEDDTWFKAPKDAAWAIRQGSWDDLRDMIAADVVVEGRPEFDRDAILSLLRARSAGSLDAFATHPHAYGRRGDKRWVKFWGVYSRGDLEKKTTIPIVQTWEVVAEMEERDGRWQVVTLEIRDTISPGGSGLPLPR